MTAAEKARPLEPGRNCWRIERADKASIVVDADNYFRAARQAMLAAEKRIMLIGWDFDARVRLPRVGPRDRGPETLGRFVLWLVRHRPELEVYLLRWDFGAVKALFRGVNFPMVIRWMLHRRIHVRLDGAHPVGASHHQKIVVVDDCLAFCGGIDMTIERWDTREHVHRAPERVGPSGKPYDAWHDATTALEGPVADAIAELGRQRWERSGGKPIAPVTVRNSCWPESLTAQFRDVEVAIARTRPLYGSDDDEVHEIETLYLDLIARAERTVYVEGQYFASRKIGEAIARRLGEPDGPEFLLITPKDAHGWLEQEAMDSARARLVEAVRRVDKHGRFRMYCPVTSGGDPIYVHAKVMVVDDMVLRVGSSNMNNRSLRLDTECDVAIDATYPGNEATPPVIRSIRNGLLAEQLGAAPEEVERVFAETGSLIATVERLRGEGRSLRPYEVPDLNAVETFLADHEVLDPEGPEEMFEAIGKRSLFRRLRKPFERKKK